MYLRVKILAPGELCVFEQTQQKKVQENSVEAQRFREPSASGNPRILRVHSVSAGDSRSLSTTRGIISVM